MDYYYNLKSDNSKVWLVGIKAKDRLEFTSEAGYFNFIGNDGQEYTVLDVKATNIFDLNGWSSLLMAIFWGALLFPIHWCFGLYAFVLAFFITRLICTTINCNVEHFNNSFLRFSDN